MPDLSDCLAYLPLLLTQFNGKPALSLISAVLQTTDLHLHLGCNVLVDPATLNQGEYPACAAMTTGYVFRVENEATVYYLQSIGVTGTLAHLKVFRPASEKAKAFPTVLMRTSIMLVITTVLHVILVKSSLHNAFPHPLVWVAVALMVFQLLHDRGQTVPVLNAVYSAIIVFLFTTLIAESISNGTLLSRALQLSLLLILSSRILFTYIIAQRSVRSWHGASEPNMRGSLLVLLSRDRWVRLDGEVDDLKAVTSGSWLRPATTWEEVLEQLSIFLFVLAQMVSFAATKGEKIILILVVAMRHIWTLWRSRRAVLLEKGIEMHGRVIQVDVTKAEGGWKRCGRRLEMAEELIREFARRDWAEQMGLVRAEGGSREVVM